MGNWNDKLTQKKNDGKVPLPSGFQDAWIADSRHAKDKGYTYDAKVNPMLLGNLRNRLDRAFFKGNTLNFEKIDMIGQHPIPGVTYLKKTKRNPAARPFQSSLPTTSACTANSRCVRKPV